MGTRGIMAFTHEGVTKHTYNHFDSYPTGLGKDIAEWTASLDDAAVAEAIEKFKNLQEVDENEKPTPEQVEALAQYTDLRVSGGTTDDWYCLLRDTQGDPQATLDAGYFMSHPWGEEWAYDINLGERTVDIYPGGIGGKPIHSFKFGDEPNDEMLEEIESKAWDWDED